VFLLFATFIMVRLIPGDPALLIAGMDQATPERIASIRREIGTDRPWPEQFVQYVQNFARGDFGSSFTTKQPVSSLIRDRIGPSLQLAVLGLVITLFMSLPLGMLAAHITREGRHPRFELVWTSMTAMFGAIPSFLLATLLIFIFSVWLRALPVAGTSGWQSLVLPVAAICLGPTLTVARIVRLQTLDALAQDYVRTARSKRLPQLSIYLRHVMPNVLTVALTIGGVLFSGLIAGTVFVEQIFSRLGMGTALVGAVITHDYPVVQTIVLLLGMAVVIVNTIVDVLLGLVDPRSLAGPH
jgi:peptide/nickel transport system permease protein